MEAGSELPSPNADLDGGRISQLVLYCNGNKFPFEIASRFFMDRSDLQMPRAVVSFGDRQRQKAFVSMESDIEDDPKSLSFARMATLSIRIQILARRSSAPGSNDPLLPVTNF
jgi:hypothetical protein